MSLSDIALIVVVIFLEILIVRLFDSVWPSKTGQRIIVISAIVVDVILIIFLSSVGQKPVAHIRSHLEGGEIPAQITLLGDYENLDDDDDLWVYVYSPSTGNYYFYEAALYYNVQTWDARGLLVGSNDESDAGKSFELGVLAANSQASQRLREGIKEIPEGVILVSERITLRRIGDVALATPKPIATNTPAPVPTDTLAPTRIPANTNTSNPTLPPTQPATPKPTNTSTPTPVLGTGSTDIRAKDGAVMVYVPAGNFDMGSGNSAHSVYLNSYWIDQIEVTNGMYDQCVTDEDCRSPETDASYTYSSHYGNADFDDYPVIEVSWNDAVAYCEWADARLPTEAEWEKAASWDEEKQEARTYPWGKSIDCSYANYYLGNVNYCVGDTTAVGSYPDGASPYEALDMAGNVWEWTGSLYQSYPYDADDGRENASSTGFRVLRGGSWYSGGYFVRAANRSTDLDPSIRDSDIGFRCAQE